MRVSSSEIRSEAEAIIAELVREQLGAAVARVEWLRGALGSRQFSRVRLQPIEEKREFHQETLIARIECAEDPSRRPAGIAPEPALEPIRALLEAEGLPVPRRLGGDPARGIELLEDLGDVSLADFARMASAAEIESLYAEACELPARLQRIAPRAGIANFERALEDAHFRYKAERFARWSVRGERGATLAEASVVRDAFDRIARAMGGAPRRLAHRDLQSANLIIVGGAQRDERSSPGRTREHASRNGQRERTSRSGERERASRSGKQSRLAMIDLQGALMAPPEYDLVCLLRDSYVELEPDTVAALRERARTTLPDAPDRETFELRFDLLTLARKAKDHALFRAVAAERGDERYLRYLASTHRYLAETAARVAAKHSEYEDLNELIQAMPEDS
jgi:hypothetical protein